MFILSIIIHHNNKVITRDTTDSTSLVTLHLYCPVVLVVYDVLLLLSIASNPNSLIYITVLWVVFTIELFNDN